jgi:hypothetical protein
VDTLYYSSKMAHVAARILASSEFQTFEVGAAEQVGDHRFNRQVLQKI